MAKVEKSETKNGKKVVESGEKCQKVVKSREKWGKWGKVSKSGEKW